MQGHKIWIEQCEATHAIKERFGVQNALDYLIGEKLLGFVAAAADRPAFAQELPAFLREIRRIFTLEEIEDYLDRFEREKASEPLLEFEDEAETDEAWQDSPAFIAEEILRFAKVRAMLLRPE